MPTWFNFQELCWVSEEMKARNETCGTPFWRHTTGPHQGTSVRATSLSALSTNRFFFFFFVFYSWKWMAQQNPESLDIWGKPLTGKLVISTYKQERKTKEERKREREEGMQGGREGERNLEENRENHRGRKKKKIL